MEDKELYQRILGLEEPWQVNDIELDIPGGEVVLRLAYAATRGQCPECGEWYAFHDHAPERRWRHLDTCQLRTEIRCRVPRAPGARSAKVNMHEMSMLAFRNGVFRALNAFSIAVSHV